MHAWSTHWQVNDHMHTVMLRHRIGQPSHGNHAPLCTSGTGKAYHNMRCMAQCARTQAQPATLQPITTFTHTGCRNGNPASVGARDLRSDATSRCNMSSQQQALSTAASSQATRTARCTSPRSLSDLSCLPTSTRMPTSQSILYDVQRQPLIQSPCSCFLHVRAADLL